MSKTDTTPEASQVETSQVSEEQTPVVEDQNSTEPTEVENPEEATQKQKPSEVQESGEGQQQNEEERKPNRFQRRLQQVYKKGMQENHLAELLSAMPEPEPDENGYFTPEQVRQMAAVEAAKTLQLEREAQAYQQQKEGFISEIEEVGNQILEDFKDNTELAETVNRILTTQLEAANVRTDERGNQFLVPVQRPKALYAEIKKALEMTSNQGTEKATAALARQVAEGAITPSAASGSEGSSLKDLQQNLWKNPGKVASELASRLPRGD